MKNDCDVDTKKVYKRVEDFLKDDKFIKYVLDAAPEIASYWKKFLEEHTELLTVFEEARSMLLASEKRMQTLSPFEVEELKQRIFITLKIEDENY